MVSYARAPRPYSMQEAISPDNDGVTLAPASRSVAFAIISVVFIFSLIIPVSFVLGQIRLSPYRIILLTSLIPTLGMWLAGKAGRIRVADILVLAFASWTVISTLRNMGLGSYQFAGIYFIETVGAYMLGRVFVRDLAEFLKVTKALFWVLMILAPFAAAESYLFRPVYAPLFAPLGKIVNFAGIDPRMGLNRAQTAFEHPILYGVFCASTFSLLYFLPRRNAPGKVAGLRRAFVSMVATFFSLSSGAFIPVAIQIGLIAWNRILASITGRWKLLVGLVVAAYVFVDLLSNRTPFEVFASLLAFNGSTYYWRVLIFTYGMQNVWAHPLLGYGTGGNWVRPSWMVTATVDNFWLLMAMRYGIPAFLFSFGTLLAVVTTLIRTRIVDPIVAHQRLALVFVHVAVAIAIGTVFLWNASYVYFMFMLGASLWIADWPVAEEMAKGGIETEGDPLSERVSPYSRQTRSQRKRFETTGKRDSPAQKGPQRRQHRRVETRASKYRDHKRQTDEGH